MEEKERRKKENVTKRKKKTRRGKNRTRDLTIFYNNVNGIRSKYVSVVNIVKKIQPVIFALCETKLGSTGKLKKSFPEYELITRITKPGKGGLLIAVRKHFFFNCMDVTSSPDKNIVVARLGLTETSAIRLILAYGPQESESAEDREAFVTELAVETQRCLDHGDEPIIIGDLNGKLEKEDKIQPISPNGKLVYEFVCDYNLNILNFDEKCTGKWTRVKRTTGEKSVLDYVIAGNTITKGVTEMLIDEECLMCPFHMKKEKGKEVVKFSDHNSILLKAVIETPARRKDEPQFMWRINDHGKEVLKEITQQEIYVPPALVNDPQQNYNILENEINMLANNSFSRVKLKRKEPCAKVGKKYQKVVGAIMKFARKGKAQRNVAQKHKKMIMELNQAEERIFAREVVRVLEINKMAQQKVEIK